MTDWLPDVLVRTGWMGLASWQWIGIPLALVVAVICGRVVARFAVWIGGRLTARTASTWDDDAVRRLARPLRFTAAVLAMRALIPLLDLPPQLRRTAHDVMLAAFGVGVIWCAVRIIDLVIARLAASPWAIARPASRGLLHLAGRTIKFVLALFAAIGFLGALGLPVGSLIAGVGVGGIAIAFGAKQTVENLFGAFSLGIDQPLREGDFVRTDSGVEGTVEAVGLRSTRIRTNDRTVVSMPNGRLADSKIETFGLRDRCRLATWLGLDYQTTSAQVREIIAAVEAMLRAHPRTFASDLVVKLAKLGESSLQVEVQAYYDGSEYAKFRDWRQDMLLGCLEIVERAGARLAFPTQTIHVASLPSPSSSPSP